MGHVTRSAGDRPPETGAAGALAGRLMEGPPEIAFLRQVPLFRDVEDSVLRALWPSFRARRLRKGDVLFRTGDPGEELFLLKEGSIVVSRPVTGRVEQVLARVVPGEELPIEHHPADEVLDRLARHGLTTHVLPVLPTRTAWQKKVTRKPAAPTAGPRLGSVSRGRAGPTLRAGRERFG